MKALRLELRARNNRLWYVIHAEAPTVAAFCRAHNLSNTAVGRLLNFTESPYCVDGSPRGIAARLADIARDLVDELFPRELYRTVLPKTFALEVDPEQLCSLAAARSLALPPTQDDAIIAGEFQAAVGAALDTLTPRQRKVIQLRFGLDGNDEHALVDVGRVFGIGVERVRQIEAEALRKLRQPRRARLVRPFTDWRDREVPKHRRAGDDLEPEQEA